MLNVSFVHEFVRHVSTTSYYDGFVLFSEVIESTEVWSSTQSVLSAGRVRI